MSSQVGRAVYSRLQTGIPWPRSPKHTEGPKISNKLERFKNVSILIAEDNLVNQFMLSKMLKDWGVIFEIVDNGRKLIDRLQAKDFDLILMDTYMPEMNGLVAARTIRQDFTGNKKNIPIISLSAASFDYEQEEALAAGMNEVVTKPFQPAELHKIIKNLLSAGQSPTGFSRTRIALISPLPYPYRLKELHTFALCSLLRKHGSFLRRK